jgi:hypothetical protein
MAIHCHALNHLETGGLEIGGKWHYVYLGDFGPTFRPFAPVKLGARSDKLQRSTIRISCAQARLKAMFQNER